MSRSTIHRLWRALAACLLGAALLAFAGTGEAHAAPDGLCQHTETLTTDFLGPPNEVDCSFEVTVPSICQVRYCVLTVTSYTTGVGWYSSHLSLTELSPSRHYACADRFSLLDDGYCINGWAFVAGTLTPGATPRVTCAVEASPVHALGGVTCSAEWHTP